MTGCKVLGIERGGGWELLSLLWRSLWDSKRNSNAVIGGVKI